MPLSRVAIQLHDLAGLSPLAGLVPRVCDYCVFFLFSPLAFDLSKEMDRPRCGFDLASSCDLWAFYLFPFIGTVSCALLHMRACSKGRKPG